MKKGISLIVLVITIIVMIILAASVVITLSNTGVIDRASESVEKTTLSELKHYASLVWSEEYLAGKRGDELKLAVLDKLKDYTTKYDIVVTNSGVDVNNKVASCFPLVWNTLQESDVTVEGDGMIFMKISDATPKAEEFANAYVTFDDIKYGGQVIQAGQTLPYDYKEEYANATAYGNYNMAAVSCLVVYKAGEVEQMGGMTFPETGIYVMSFKKDGIEMNVKVGVILPKLDKPNITFLNNILTINPVEKATAYEVYLDDELILTTAETRVDLTNKVSSISDYFISVRSIAAEKYDPSYVASLWNSTSKEEPGLYDENGNIICSMPSLKIDYQWGTYAPLTVHNYSSNTAGLCYILNNNLELKTATKLVFDFETEIVARLFMGCSQLKEIILPEDLTILGASAFDECTNLQSIRIPKATTEIYGGLFYNCDNLAAITVEEGNTVYYSKDNCIIKSADKTLVAGCKNSIIPSDGSVTVIGFSAFYGCNGLTELLLPAEITKIGNSCFSECKGLIKVDFEDNSQLTKLENGAFSNCINLEEIKIPATLKNFIDGVFRGDKKLARVIFEEPKTWYYTDDAIAAIKYAKGSVTSSECANPEFMANKILTTNCYQWFCQ